MKKLKSNTALLLFARSARSESNSKVILDHRRANYELIKFLNGRSYKIAQASGLDYFLIDEEKQVGASFGDRLANAFETIFKQGYKHVIAIGNDSPDLSVEDLIRASQSLQHHDAVLGPDARGGAYLIGLKSSKFDKTSFVERVNWQSKNTLLHLLDWMTDYELLGQKIDLNHLDDLKLIASHSSRSLRRRLLHLAQLIREQVSVPDYPKHTDLKIRPSGLRAPPIA